MCNPKIKVVTVLVSSLLIGSLVTVEAASARDRGGKRSKNVKKVINSFTLINADTQKAIRRFNPVPNGAVLNVERYLEKGVALRANTTPRRGIAVRFRMKRDDGTIYNVVDRRAPYIISARKGRALAAGNYTVQATPYSNRARGTQGSTAELSFALTRDRIGGGTNPKNPDNGDVRPDPSIPGLRTWESHMVTFGLKHCNGLKDNTLSYDQKLASTYYDGEWVFYQIGDYTRDRSWYTCAQAAEAVYSQRYVLGSNGTVPGYWNFSHGVTRDYLSTGDGSSQNATVLLSRNAAFAVDSTPLSSTVDAAYSREVAYTIMSYLNAEQVGEGHRSRTEALVGQALGHMDQWFVSRTAPYVRPFMFALTAHALISYYEQIGGNPNILPGIARGADWIWNNTWLPGSQAFKYTDRVVSSGGTEPAPDLNLLIAPVYAWLWHQTGNPVYRDRADQIFAGGVDGAYLHNGKQFNQNYRWSFDFIRWRSMAPRR